MQEAIGDCKGFGIFGSYSVKEVKNMSKKDKKDIANTVKALKFIADNDPQALVIANSTSTYLKLDVSLSASNQQTTNRRKKRDKGGVQK